MTKKTIFYYVIEVLFAGVIIYFSIKLFLVYFFIVWLIKSFQLYDLLRKQIRVNLFTLEVKVLSIIKKLNITHEDVCNQHDESLALLKNIDPQLLKSLERDARGIGADIYK